MQIIYNMGPMVVWIWVWGDGSIKPKASEWIALYSVLRHFCEVTLADVENVDLPRRSFEAACRVLDAIIDMKWGRVVDWNAAAENLRQKQVAHRQAHVLAYGHRFLIPKDHACLHIPSQVARDKAVLDMFVIERLNIWFKKASEAVRNTGRFEYSSLSTSLTTQRAKLAEKTTPLIRGLLGASQHLPGFGADVSFTRSAYWEGRTLTEDDVVKCGSHCGVMVAAASQGGDLFVLVRLLRLNGRRTLSSGRYALTDTLQSFSVAETHEAHAWYSDGGCLVVLW